MSVPPPNDPASGPSDPYANGPVPTPQGPGGPIPSGPGGPVGAPVSKTKWIVQLVVTGVTTLLCAQFAIVSLILSIVALVKVNTDLAGANKFFKWGWIAYAIGWAVTIIFWIILAASGVLANIATMSTTTS
jgi:hypothetical protein